MFKYITRRDDYHYTELWAYDNINVDMYDYAMRLVLIYKPTDKFYLEPPYVTKPILFINRETIVIADELNIDDYTYD